jgi:hypothetical protein
MPVAPKRGMLRQSSDAIRGGPQCPFFLRDMSSGSSYSKPSMLGPSKCAVGGQCFQLIQMHILHLNSNCWRKMPLDVGLRVLLLDHNSNFPTPAQTFGHIMYLFSSLHDIMNISYKWWYCDRHSCAVYAWACLRLEIFCRQEPKPLLWYARIVTISM